MKRICGAAAAFALTLSAKLALAQSYYIEEVTDFTGNGCESTNVNTITASMQTAMINAGWPGQRWGEWDCDPQDWREGCSSSFGAGGVDYNWADLGWSFSVYAGHGSVGGGEFFFGYPQNGVCSNVLGTNSRLGSMWGGAPAVTAYMSSCTLKVSSLVNNANLQWVWQQLGFHDSPGIQGNTPRNFFNCTNTITNSGCWLSNMEEDGVSDNSPVVVSYGATAAEVVNVRANAKLKGGVYLWPKRPNAPSCNQGQPQFFYEVIYINNGSGGC